ncbi:MAG: 30S ribosomal protein S16 [Candidatus Parcubacteria bacterium]|nr:30S ribosomal protein S16 [Candidatus Parcubacteria bacterium]
MLAIRLSRKGKKKQPLYRIIVNEKTKDPWGDYLENLGFYNSRTKELNLKADRIKYWLNQGAQPSDTLWNMFITKGLIEGKKRTVTKISKKRLAKITEKQKQAELEIKKSAPVPEAVKEQEKPVQAETPQAG